MDKEEVLRRSIQENKGRDEMEQKVFTDSGQKACAAGGILGAIMVMAEGLIFNRFNEGIFAIVLVMTGTMLLFKGIELKKKQHIVVGVVELLLAVSFLVIYVKELLGR